MGDQHLKTDDKAGVTQPIVLVEEPMTGGFKRHCRVPEDLVFFQGHFDRAAVVAGVVQLKWVVDAIGEHTGQELQLSGMEAVKFHHLLFPGQEFIMEVVRDDKKRKWGYRIVRDEHKIASGRLVEKD